VQAEVFRLFYRLEENEKGQSGFLKSSVCFFQIRNRIIGVFIFYASHCGGNRKAIPIVWLFFFVFSLRRSTKSSASCCFDSGNEATVANIFSDKFMFAAG